MTDQTTLTERPVTRRWVLGGLSATALLAAGCASTSGTSATTTSSATAASTGTASTAALSTTNAKTSSVATLARRFYNTLDADQRAVTLLDYSLTDAKRWSNLPQGLISGGGPGGGPGGSSSSTSSTSSSGRPGISLGELSTKQLKAFAKMLRAATGTTTGLGYDEITMHLDADDYLAENGGGDSYGRENFYVALLGTPSDSGTWELMFGGHHLAVANTYVDGQLVGATPAFRGIEPDQAFTWNGATEQVLKVKEDAMRAMLAGLSADQQAEAELSDVYSDLVLGPGNDWVFPTEHEGLAVSSLSQAQRRLVLAAVATYVDDLADSDAAVILKRYKKELKRTYVAWSGTTALTEQNDYVRIDGPSVWIEFSMQHGIVLSGNHPHSVWRDRTTDYGGTQS